MDTVKIDRGLAFDAVVNLYEYAHCLIKDKGSRHHIIQVLDAAIELADGCVKSVSTEAAKSMARRLHAMRAEVDMKLPVQDKGV